MGQLAQIKINFQLTFYCTISQTMSIEETTLLFQWVVGTYLKEMTEVQDEHLQLRSSEVIISENSGM